MSAVFVVASGSPPTTTGSVDGVRNILSYKQEWASIRDKDGATPLMHAANRGYKEVSSLCLDNIVKLSTRDFFFFFFFF